MTDRPARRRTSSAAALAAQAKETILVCPKCQADMEKSLMSGVTVDICREHGMWLDKGELSRLFDGARVRSSSTARRAADQARHEGKLHGIMFGWMSLFYR